ncbi:MAG: biotin--[acetyl-CoA-carboxylase] ligase [Cyanobacteria bacterium RUI128]|nr:biotin--[acetyl-CoA-carboxylase] ligase [Cyanobacteria bacterium RUI128]
MKLIHLDTVDSTNSYVKTHMAELDNLTFVYSDRQTNGRGRLSRKWLDTGEDNLFLTIVIKPDTTSNISAYLPNLTQYLSVVLCDVLEQNNIIPNIKWPNDVLINGKKIAGILAEGVTSGGKVQGLALGIGINLNSKAESLITIDKPATSIFNETGAKQNKEDFLKMLYENFCLLYDDFVYEGFKSIKDLYLKRASFIGKQIKINVLDVIHEGIAFGVTDDGALLLKEHNIINTYCIGDIL